MSEMVDRFVEEIVVEIQERQDLATFGAREPAKDGFLGVDDSIDLRALARAMLAVTRARLVAEAQAVGFLSIEACLSGFHP